MLLKDKLIGYTTFYRIVFSKARTHEIHDSKFNNFKKKHFKYFKYEENIIDEVI